MIDGKNTENKNEHKIGINRAKIITEVKLYRSDLRLSERFNLECCYYQNKNIHMERFLWKSLCYTETKQQEARKKLFNI